MTASDRKRLNHWRRVAYHEAGHVVASYCMGIPFRPPVTIASTNKHAGTVKHYPRPSFRAHGQDEPLTVRPLRTAALRDLADILIYCAGPEVAHGHRWLTVPRESYLDDLQEATKLAERLCGSTESVEGLLKWSRIRARDLLKKHWLSVVAVAEDLLVDGTLTGRQVSDCIRRARAAEARIARRAAGLPAAR